AFRGSVAEDPRAEAPPASPATTRWPRFRRWNSVPDLLLHCENGCMHPTGPGAALDVVIPSDPAEARRVQADIARALASFQFDDREVFSIKLALEEALVNAIKHGNQMDRSKKVHITCRIDTERFDIDISDEGDGFKPEEVPDPMAEENLERPCGRGL